MQPFLSFWGKARLPEGAATRWHPAGCHCLDVAAVAEALLRAHPAAAEAIACACGWANDDLVGTVVFLAALHDIGKFSRPFQAKAPEHWPPVLGPYGNKAGPRHDEVGLRLLRDDAILDVGTVLPGWADEQVEALCCAVAGHHGHPVQCPPRLDEHVVCALCRAAAVAFARAAADLLKPPPLARPAGRAAQTASWWLAGLITLCDWIGCLVVRLPWQLQR